MQQRETRYVRWLATCVLLSVGVAWLGWHLGAPDDEQVTVTVTQAPPMPERPRPVEEPPVLHPTARAKAPRPRPTVMPTPAQAPLVVATATPEPVPPPVEPPPAREPFSFQGIGAVLRQTEAGIVIAAVLPGSPAGAAGVRAADTILAIDGVPTSGMAIPLATQKIRGETGTSVTLDIERPGEGRQTLRIERGRITVDHAMADHPGMPMAAPPLVPLPSGQLPPPPPDHPMP